MSIKIIATIGQNNELGRYNKLIWNLSEDLRFIRKKTANKKVLMGRKTLESLPQNLDQANSIILSSKPLDKYYDVVCYNDVRKILEMFYLSEESLFVIGGASIYEQLIPYAEEMYLTEIQEVDADADAYFPNFNKADWKITEINNINQNDLSYVRNKYVRKKTKR